MIWTVPCLAAKWTCRRMHSLHLLFLSDTSSCHRLRNKAQEFIGIAAVRLHWLIVHYKDDRLIARRPHCSFFIQVYMGIETQSVIMPPPLTPVSVYAVCSMSTDCARFHRSAGLRKKLAISISHSILSTHVNQRFSFHLHWILIILYTIYAINIFMPVTHFIVHLFY